MNLRARIFILVLFANFWDFSYSQTVANIKSVITQLFTTDGYNKRVRPVADQLEPVIVSMDFYLVGIDDFNEVTQKLTTTGYLSIFWLDTELNWDPALFGNVDRIQLPQNEVWKPDITLRNGKSDMKELGGSYLLVTIDNTGEVLWEPYHNFETKCSVDVSYFPFDEQVCDIKFVSWSSQSDEIVIDHGNLGLILDEYEENGEWEILKTNSSNSKTMSEATVIYTLYLKRRPTFTVLNIIIPIMLLGYLDLCVFILPADSGEKIGFSVTVLLAFAVFLTIVSDSLPKNSIKVPALSIFLIVQIIVSTSCVLFTMIQLRLFHRDSDHPVSGAMKKFVRLIWKVQCRGNHSCCNKSKVKCVSKSDNTQVSISNIDIEPKGIEPIMVKQFAECHTPEREVTWKAVTNALDFAFFWILFIIQVGTGIAFFLIISFKLPY